VRLGAGWARADGGIASCPGRGLPPERPALPWTPGTGPGLEDGYRAGATNKGGLKEAGIDTLRRAQRLGTERGLRPPPVEFFLERDRRGKDSIVCLAMTIKQQKICKQFERK